MNKTILIVGVILPVVLGGGLFFLYQQAQADVAEINASLPEGIRVTKSLLGDGYTVVNDIDGYSFRISSNGDFWKTLINASYADGIKENLSYGLSIESISEELSSENAFYVDDAEGLRAIEVRRFTFTNPINFDSFATLFGESWAASYQGGSLVLDVSKEALVFNTIPAVKLTGTTHAPWGSENTQSESFYIFQAGEAVYLITSIGNEESFIEELVVRGNW